MTPEPNDMTPGDHDLLIEVRTLVKAILDRMSSHDRRFDNLEARVGRNESEILVLKSTRGVEREAEKDREDERRHRGSTFWAMVTAAGSVGLALITLAVFLVKG